MKVFRINDCDWVAHHSEEQAKKFYEDFTGVPMEDIEEDFQGEVPLSDTMYWDVEGVNKVDPNHNFKREQDSPYGDCYSVTFEWVLANYPDRYPGIIATTEY